MTGRQDVTVRRMTGTPRRSQGGGAASIYAIYGPTDVKLTLPKPLNRFHWRIQWQRQTERESKREREHLPISIAAHGTNMNHIINGPNQWANCHFPTGLTVVVFPFPPARLPVWHCNTRNRLVQSGDLSTYRLAYPLHTYLTVVAPPLWQPA